MPVGFERTVEGVSAQVYRPWRAGYVFYLRVAEEPGETLEVDAEVPRHLRAAGVHVPNVVYVDR